MFLGTLRDNLQIAAPDAQDAALRAALSAAGGRVGRESCRPAWTPIWVPAAIAPTASQSQQLALARVVLADPHTVILDEATALLDPRTARHTERALAAVLEGP